MSDISLLKQESITAVGIWKKSHSVVPYHSGATFHRLAEVKRHKILAISTEETIFALLRTNFILIDRESDQILLAKDIFKRIEDSNDTETLLRVHVYLSLQRIGKFPISDNIIVATPADIDIEEYIKRFKCTKHEKIELHQLLDAFKTYYESSTLRLNGYFGHLYTVDDIPLHAALADTPALSVFGAISQDTSTNIIAISNFDSVYMFEIDQFNIKIYSTW